MIKKKDSNIIIAIVPVTLASHIWPKCAKHLERVVKLCPDDFNLESIKKSVFNGDYTLVTMSELDKVVACAILEINNFDSGFKVLAIPLVAGNKMHLWAERFLSICHALAKAEGCNSLQGYAARKGWHKYLEKAGWTTVFTTIRCPVKKIDNTNIIQIKEGL